jgi:hypothetical protein
VIGTAAVCVAQIGMFGVIRINAQLRAAREELTGVSRVTLRTLSVRGVTLLPWGRA